jgi:hypothetical protein
MKQDILEFFGGTRRFKKVCINMPNCLDKYGYIFEYMEAAVRVCQGFH